MTVAYSTVIIELPRGAGHVNMRAIVRELFETVILALFIFLILQLSVQTYRVQGPSMRPTLEDHEYVLVNKLVYLRVDPKQVASLLPFVDVDEESPVYPFHPPQRGEVVIFKFPGDQTRDFVKRVIGVPNDVVEIRRGDVFVNGQMLDEPYITRRDDRSYEPYTVPPDSYYVLGDNRRASNDSRDWNAVPADNMIGRAWASFWPLDRWHSLSLTQ